MNDELRAALDKLDAALATRETRVWMGDDDWLVVREPVPVVQRMIDACREGE